MKNDLYILLHACSATVRLIHSWADYRVILKESCGPQMDIRRPRRYKRAMRRQVIVLAMTATAAQAWVPMPSFSGLTRGFGAERTAVHPHR